MTLLAIFFALVFLYSLVSGRLERTVVTAPMVFTAAGTLSFLFGSGSQVLEITPEIFLRVAEVGLVLLLFTDASRTDLRVLKDIPSRSCFSSLGWQAVARMLPVAIALIGTRLSRATVLFMGWFGPRGLASIVLGLV